MSGYNNYYGNRGMGYANQGMARGQAPQSRNMGMNMGANMAARQAMIQNIQKNQQPQNQGMAPHGQAPRMATPEEMGITYEPVESLFGGGQPTQTTPPESIPQTGAAPNENRDAFIKVLGEFVQNERNGALFYEHLSAQTNDARKKGAMKQISDASRRNSQAFGKLIKSHGGAEYVIKETQIDTRAGFSDGLHWAIQEESAALRELADLADRFDGDAPSFLTITGRKMGILGTLIGLSYNGSA